MPDGSIHRLTGSVGGLTSWANTVDRAARTEPARRKGPGSVGYWLTKLDTEKFADATDQQKLDAAEALRRAYYARLSLKSAQARRKRAA